ncbi:MAG: DNA gyrase inhibitor YacG [Myxococcales bacterium]|nr:DNA gyrase inhibitor YacG [Myxococcales bacterium]
MVSGKTCATCGRPLSNPPDAAAFPFCSDRCKLLDLGNWLDGRYRLDGPAAQAPEDDSED